MLLGASWVLGASSFGRPSTKGLTGGLTLALPCS